MKTKAFLPTLFSHRDSAIQSFESIFDKMLNNSFPEFSDSFGIDFFQKSSYPKVNVIDKEKKLVIVAEIAGMTKEDISLECKDGYLTISGGTRFDDEKQEGTFLYRELKHSSFKRSFTIDPKVYKVDQIDASFENGVLNIDIPKFEEAQVKNTAKKIAIK